MHIYMTINNTADILKETELLTSREYIWIFLALKELSHSTKMIVTFVIE